jgi:hypothetical protein
MQPSKKSNRGRRPYQSENDSKEHGDEEDAGRTYHCANIEMGASVSNRATIGIGSINSRIGRRSENTNSTDLDRMCRIVE